MRGISPSFSSMSLYTTCFPYKVTLTLRDDGDLKSSYMMKTIHRPSENHPNDFLLFVVIALRAESHCRGTMAMAGRCCLRKLLVASTTPSVPSRLRSALPSAFSSSSAPAPALSPSLSPALAHNASSGASSGAFSLLTLPGCSHY